MTVKELAELNEVEALALPDPEREIGTIYIGDLLSWVMGKAPADCAWITIMSNVNICAVAALCDTACILLAEGVHVDESVRTVALEKGINLLTTGLDAYHGALLVREHLNE